MLQVTNNVSQFAAATRLPSSGFALLNYSGVVCS
jgi:hypothetical protein